MLNEEKQRLSEKLITFEEQLKLWNENFATLETENLS